MTYTYIENLKNACKKLESIEHYTNDNINVFSMVVPIINSFNEIISIDNSEETINNSLLLIEGIKNNNPNLKGVVDAIMEILNESYKKEYFVRR